MEIEKQRTCALATLIILSVLIPIGYFLWTIFLNKGTLVLLGNAPFSVDIYFEGKQEIQVDCEKSPCKIKQKAGEKMVLVSKDAYEIFETNIDVKRGKDTELKADLVKIPSIQKIDQLPKKGEEKSYKLISDQKSKMQKLVEANDKYETPIVFFSNDIKNPKIFGNNSTVFIVNREGTNTVAYKVNVNTKGRTILKGNNFEKIVNGMWSQDGEYFVYSVANSDYLWLVSETVSSKRLKIAGKIPQATWNINDDLIFATNQEEEVNGTKDKYGREKITLKENRITEKYLFGIYDPKNDTYSRMGRFEFNDPPINLFTSGNGRELYFESGKEKYEIELY